MAARPDKALPDRKQGLLTESKANDKKNIAMHNYENLEVWKKGMDLGQEVYQITKQFPDIERFGITSQITRAAVSIPSNIAEGAGRNSNKDFVHF